MDNILSYKEFENQLNEFFDNQREKEEAVEDLRTVLDVGTNIKSFLFKRKEDEKKRDLIDKIIKKKYGNLNPKDRESKERYYFYTYSLETLQDIYKKL